MDQRKAASLIRQHTHTLNQHSRTDAHTYPQILEHAYTHLLTHVITIADDAEKNEVGKDNFGLQFKFIAISIQPLFQGTDSYSWSGLSMIPSATIVLHDSNRNEHE